MDVEAASDLPLDPVRVALPVDLDEAVNLTPETEAEAAPLPVAASVVELPAESP